MLELRDVHVRYGHIAALQGIDLEVRRGEIVALIGANGAGKTTTLMAISGVRPLSRGSITFDGLELRRRPPEAMMGLGIGHIPEGRSIFPELSVRENLLVGARGLRGRHLRRQRLAAMYTLFPRLEERKQQAGGTLSGGEQQMLAIARALIASPRLLLMDEPSMGLSPVLVEEVADLIARINGDGVTILLVEQNANVALSIAHRVYLLETGRVVLSGAPAELRDLAKVKDAYLGG
ncbi:MAG: ABC transporter ATP-binding protein [Candidatus Tectomicrobia bacterium]|nr:ABC transporter ATP-binding protein [Candidatus Tectomicrobia bacterium]